MLDTMLEALTAAMIFVGSTFILIGSFGLIKLPDLLSRLHGPSKATTVGVGGCLIASMLHFWSVNGYLSMQEMLVTLFLFITAPITAHFITKAHLHEHQELKAELPLSPNHSEWATYGEREIRVSSKVKD